LRHLGRAAGDSYLPLVPSNLVRRGFCCQLHRYCRLAAVNNTVAVESRIAVTWISLLCGSKACNNFYFDVANFIFLISNRDLTTYSCNIVISFHGFLIFLRSMFFHRNCNTGPPVDCDCLAPSNLFSEGTPRHPGYFRITSAFNAQIRDTYWHTYRPCQPEPKEVCHGLCRSRSAQHIFR
jgi:hypothetical protein